MTDSIRVALVDLSPEGFNGSMGRYAKLVDAALAGQSTALRRIEVDRIKLTLPFRFPTWLPSGVRVWVNHLWIILTVRRRISKCQPDLVHVLDGSYGYVVRRLRKVPTLATVHDLIPLLQQQGKFGPDKTSFLSRLLVRKTVQGLRSCKSIIADSESTRRDLVEAAGIIDSEISVVPIALDPEYLGLENVQKIDTIGSDKNPIPFILHVGNNGLYKNREGVLRVFELVARECTTHLVLVGERPSPNLMRLAVKLGLADKLEIVHDPADATLRGLYQSASLLLFPSIYEGFGWPPLEAMACRCPVVCSSAASLPEVVGDAALMAPAADHAGLAKLCISLLQDPLLAERQIRKGLQRAQQFTIERMGDQLLDVYDDILSRVKLSQQQTRESVAR